ncbi:MAG TPA: hypothetical protein VG860_17755, partial [Terriglobia bacterium]|nr:hypothetical protein [Terriglobia bacterium]
WGCVNDDDEKNPETGLPAGSRAAVGAELRCGRVEAGGPFSEKTWRPPEPPRAATGRVTGYLANPEARLPVRLSIFHAGARMN